PMLGYFHEPEPYQVKAVGHIALVADDLSLLKAQQFDMLPQVVDEVPSQRRQYRHAAQVRIQRALLVSAVKLLAESLVALHDVENVTQHLEHRAIGLCPHCRRARVVTHASHLPEQFARAQFGNRVLIREIHRSVDGYVGASAFFFALIDVARGEQALQLAQESLRTALGLDMGNRAGQIYFRCALQYVERGRPKFPLTTNDVACPEMLFHNRILVQFQKRSRNVLENRQADKNIWIDRPTFEVTLNHAPI